MISAQATGVLAVCVYQGIQPTSPPLVERFRGVKRHGKDFMQAVLKELEDAGFIERPKSKVGNDIRTIGVITDAGYNYLVELGFPAPGDEATGAGNSRPLLQQYGLTNHSSLTSVNSKEYTGTESREEKFVKVDLEVREVGSWGGMFESSSSDELVDSRRQSLKAKRDAAQEDSKDKQKSKMLHRSMIEPSLWTVSDVKYEFADRVSRYWNIQPWSVSTSRFGYALSSMRKRLDTNGEIEVKMIDLFFSVVNINNYDNAESLWRLFIHRADEFASQAKAMIRTDEQIETAKVDAKRTQEWMYE